MTRFALAAAVVVVLAGCSLRGNAELKKLVRDVTPLPRTSVGCEWGSGRGDAAKEDYGCLYVVRGAHDRVLSEIHSRLERLGFSVTPRTNAHSTALIGVRGRRGVCAYVLERGWIHSFGDDAPVVVVSGRWESKSDDVPRGSVFVDVSAYLLRAGERMPDGTACAG